MSQRLGTDRTNGLLLVAAMVTLMWILEVVDVAADHRLDNYGIHPRDVDGLPEIFAAPFLHAGFGHLVSNTVPFLAMGAAIALGGLMRVALVTLIVAAVSGFGTWLIAASNSVHLGASGVVFGYATYLVARGIFSRRLRCRPPRGEPRRRDLVGLFMWGVNKPTRPRRGRASRPVRRRRGARRDAARRARRRPAHARAPAAGA